MTDFLGDLIDIKEKLITLRMVVFKTLSLLDTFAIVSFQIYQLEKSHESKEIEKKNKILFGKT